MRIAVIGAGGVGGYFGGRLAAAGADVGFLARGVHAAAIREHGLRIRSQLGDVNVKARVEEDPAALGPADVVIIAVKLWDTVDIVRRIAPLVTSGTAVFSLQNGVTKDAILRDVFGAERTMGALCYIGAIIAEPGVIAHTGTIQKIVIGEFGGAPSPRVQTLHDLFTRASVDIDVSNDIERATWEKFVFLTGLSGATSVIRQPIGTIRSNEGARALLGTLFAEATAVGRARGVRLDEAFAADRLRFADTLPPGFSSSMHGDLERGNRLELPWLSGTVAQFGRESGVATPASDFVVEALSVYVDGAPAPVKA